MADYFHLSGAQLEPGSVVLPGNWGRVVKAAGWNHNNAVREMALEAARVARFPQRPSRLEAAFAFPTRADCDAYRNRHQGMWMLNIIYRVSLCRPDAPAHTTDSEWYLPTGPLRHDWTDLYWMDENDRLTKLFGPNWKATNVAANMIREVVTLSPLQIEERLS